MQLVKKLDKINGKSPINCKKLHLYIKICFLRPIIFDSGGLIIFLNDTLTEKGGAVLVDI